jgi:DNA replication protein DnaC
VSAKVEKAKAAACKAASPSCDPARIHLLLGQLRLPAIQAGWQNLAAEADRESWPAARFLGALAELEIAERDHRRIERHLNDARLPSGKSLYNFDFTDVPTISKAQVMALTESRDWLERGGNLLFFGQPGCGKTHLAAGIGRALVEKGLRVLFVRTTDLVQRLQVARRELALEAAIAKLDKFHILIMDDIGYVRKDQSETSVLFELICARYERRSILITANKTFGQWEKVFNEPAMTVAAIDRIVHHAIIFEMKVKRSHRWNEAISRMNITEPDPSDDNTVS